MPIETDLDLPPMKRTLAMFWQLEYRKAMAELVKSNRVIERLSRRIKTLRALQTDANEITEAREWRVEIAAEKENEKWTEC